MLDILKRTTIHNVKQEIILNWWEIQTIQNMSINNNNNSFNTITIIENVVLVRK